MENQVLSAIRERRSIYRFSPDKVSDEGILAILDAGRWAPSWTNTQPWDFILVRDPVTKDKICDIAKNMLLIVNGADIEGCSCIIVVCVDPRRDPYHYIEDGAVATQNMALAAHSLGLSSYWAGVFDLGKANGSMEQKVRELLGVPDPIRIVSILPIGAPAYGKAGDRKSLRNMLHYDKYDNRSDYLKLQHD